MIKYNLEIKTPGKIIIFHNVQVRTPVSINVTHKELKQIKIQMNRIGIMKNEYSIKEIDKINSFDELPQSIILNNESIINMDQLSVPEIEELLGMEKKK